MFSGRSFVVKTSPISNEEMSNSIVSGNFSGVAETFTSWIICCSTPPALTPGASQLIPHEHLSQLLHSYQPLVNQHVLKHPLTGPLDIHVIKRLISCRPQ